MATTVKKCHVATANQRAMMSDDITKQSPQYPFAFSKLPQRPAGVYWAVYCDVCPQGILHVLPTVGLIDLIPHEDAKRFSHL